MPNAIEIRGVTKTFGTKFAVKDLDLTIPEGSLYAFIGPNGAGKTTTIRMIMSILFPDSGEISVLGKKSAVESKDRIGYLPEERGIYRKMKVGAFLNYMGKLKGMDSGPLDKTVKAWLSRVGLAETYRKKCEELSKGMQQKVQFISAIIHKPDLIILDEPFSGLDPVNRRLLRQLIEELRGDGRTIIFSTHAMFEAEQLCTHLFMIHRGLKVLDDTLTAVLNAYDPRSIEIEPLAALSHVDPAIFRGIPGVVEARMGGASIELSLDESGDAGKVMARAAELCPVRRIEIKRPSLEDIFIRLVGGEAESLRDELAGAGLAETTKGRA
ncbi:MAG: ATP-binding cassette domain-containing protein [Planctomycetota bacterium]